MNENAKTLEVYEENFQKFIDNTPAIVTGDVKTWIDESLGYIPKGGYVLELGAANGRDAKYMQDVGYKVLPTDASKSFVKVMRDNGLQPMLLNALSDPLGGPFDMIFANAVLLHFTKKEMQEVVRKIHLSLKEEGVFSFRMKNGTGSEWSTHKLEKPRFFQFWSPEELTTLLKNNDFRLLSLTKGSSKFNDFKWLQVIARKS